MDANLDRIANFWCQDIPEGYYWAVQIVVGCTLRHSFSERLFKSVVFDIFTYFIDNSPQVNLNHDYRPRQRNVC
jgi:hypothetical protein